MFIHMFAFRWKPGVTDEQKQRVITEIRKLQGQIPGPDGNLVGLNISPRGQGYELGGVMKFTDQAALDAYGPHPVHQKLLSWLIPLIEPIEVDFETERLRSEPRREDPEPHAARYNFFRCTHPRSSITSSIRATPAKWRIPTPPPRSKIRPAAMF